MNKNDLKIVILTLREPYIPDRLIKSGYSIVGLAETKNKFKKYSKIKKLFWLIYIYIFRQHSRHLSVYAKKNGIKYYEYNDSCVDRFKTWLKDINPHILLLDSAPIIPDEVLKIPSIGTINSHTSLLPKYRGVNPTFWLYYNMDFNAGVTIHYVDKNIDTGEIISQASVPIKPGTDGITLEHELSTKYAYELLEEFFESILKKTPLPGFVQPANSPTSYARKLNDSEYYELICDQAIDLKRFWHTLHSNNQWKNVFIKEAHTSKYCDWSLSNFKNTEHNKPPYKLITKKGKYIITHPQGFVFIEKKYNLKKILKSIIS